MNENFVSIIIPTYNRSETIGNTIMSVLNQSYTNLEVIIVDDASTDNTEEIINKINDERIRYVKNVKNIGANASRNKGLSYARGEYIALIDSADRWEKSKIDKQLIFLRKHSEEYDVVFCSEHVTTLDGDFFTPSNDEKDLISKGRLEEILSSGKNCIDTSSIFCKRKCFDIVGTFDEELPRCQEYEWLIRAIQICKIGFIDECLVESNVRKDSISSDIYKLLYAIPKIYNKHHDYFVRHKKPIDILLVPIKELYRTDREFIFYKKYFELMDWYIDDKWKLDKRAVYFKILEFSFRDNILKHYQIQSLKNEYNFGSLIKKKEKFNIFGAGKMAKDFFVSLKKSELDELIEFVVVTSENDNYSLSEKTILIEAKRCDEQIKSTPLLLVINYWNMLSIVEMLKQLNFKKIIPVFPDEWE